MLAFEFWNRVQGDFVVSPTSVNQLLRWKAHLALRSGPQGCSGVWRRGGIRWGTADGIIMELFHGRVRSLGLVRERREWIDSEEMMHSEVEYFLFLRRCGYLNPTEWRYH